MNTLSQEVAQDDLQMSPPEPTHQFPSPEPTPEPSPIAEDTKIALSLDEKYCKGGRFGFATNPNRTEIGPSAFVAPLNQGIPQIGLIDASASESEEESSTFSKLGSQDQLESFD